MPADLSHIRDMLNSVSKDALDAIGRVIQEVRNEFARRGAFGNSRMPITSAERVKEVFRSAANTMATKARLYTGGISNGVDALVDQTLSNLIDTTLATYFQEGWDAQFKPELIRLKDDAVRDLRFMPSDQPIGMTITVAGNTGGVNVAAGHGNTASQTIVNEPLAAALLEWLAQVRSATTSSNMPNEARTEILDQIDYIETEVNKATPDQGRLMRWTKRLRETAEKVGVSVASGVITGWLKSHGIG